MENKESNIKKELETVRQRLNYTRTPYEYYKLKSYETDLEDRLYEIVGELKNLNIDNDNGYDRRPDNETKFNYITSNNSIAKLKSSVERKKKLFDHIYDNMIDIPGNFDVSNCWDENEIPEIMDMNYNYGDSKISTVYNRIVPSILTFLKRYSDWRVIRAMKTEEKFFKDKKSTGINLNTLSPDESQRLHRLYNYVFNYFDELESFIQDFERIIKETYDIINYDMNAVEIYYNLENGYRILNYILRDNATLHIDLLNMKYYTGFGRNYIYDPRSKNVSPLTISNYRLNGFTEMVNKYRNNYNYLVGVYYNSRNSNELSDLQVGITGSFNWWNGDREKLEQIRTLLDSGLGSFALNKRLLELNENSPVFIEIPIFAAQREIYEESRLFFRPENIKFESNNVHDGFERDSRLVYSFVVDVKDAEIVDYKTSQQIFENSERFQPINNIFMDFKEYDSMIESNYYHIRNQPDNIFDNRMIKVSVLIVGNDLRDVLKITKSEIRELNDNIRMVSCIGKNIEIDIIQ
jgi:hypothetical protein